jgi:Peptidase family M28/PA domain
MNKPGDAVMVANSARKAIRCMCGIGALILLAGTPRALASGDAADEAMAKIRPEAIRAEMSFLSDDLLEGRGTATRGHEIAARYMATQFEGMGLEPAGDNGTYFQEVPLRAMRIDQAKSAITLTRGDKKETLVFGKDYILRSDPGRAESTVEAPMVFAGFGVTAPGQGYDDYKGIDAKGKIVACLFGAPNFESALKAHYSSSIEKARNAVAHGAVGMIVLDDPNLENSYPFQKFVRDLVNPQFHWLDKEGRPNDYFPKLEGIGLFSIPATEKLFEGAEHSADEIYAAEKKNQTYSFALPVTARLHTVTHSKEVKSPNVVAKIEGSDPVLKNEYVIYSAHLDHLGIGVPVNGDKIYNGALDNASGSAMLLEMARAFSSMNPKPRRSILLLSVTGEEEGLLGSDYFAHYPTVEKHSIVADVNVDEIFMLWPMKDIIAFGAEHSSLENVVQKALKRMNLTQSPDPMPSEVVFIRSDQYSFVKQGIPSIMPSPGFQTSDANIHPMEVFQKWEETRYHEPQDDMEQPGLDFHAAAEFARFAFLCGYYISEETTRPEWDKGDFFGEHYGSRAN